LIGRVSLFIGYSVSDVGVRYLIYRLHKLWAGSACAQARPQAYVFLGRPNPVQARVLSSWGIVPLFAEGPDIGEGLKQFLESLLKEVRRGTSEERDSRNVAPASVRAGRRKNSRG